MISPTRMEAPEHAAVIMQTAHDLHDLTAHHCIITKIDGSQTGSHMEPTRGMEILNGDFDIRFGHGRIHSDYVGQQGLERVIATTHIQQPLIGQDFRCYHIVATISIGIQTRLPVVAEIII